MSPCVLLLFVSLVCPGVAQEKKAATCQKDDPTCHFYGSNLLQKQAITNHLEVGAAKGEDEIDEEEEEDRDEEDDGEEEFEEDNNSFKIIDRVSLAQLGIADMGLKPVTDVQRDRFMSRHNMYRCMHGVPDVTWSEAMAADAAIYADPLTKMEHSDSYNIAPPAGPAGENLASSYWPKSPEQATDMWYGEVNDCATGSPTSFTDGCATGKMKDGKERQTGHFTAMVWKGVTEIGCAYSSSSRVTICRYRAGDTLTDDTPNMNKAAGNYINHVLVRIKSANECVDGSAGTSDSDPPPPESGAGMGLARYVRVFPQTWFGSVTTRMAVIVGDDLHTENPPEETRRYSSVVAFVGQYGSDDGFPGSYRGCSKVDQGARQYWRARHSRVGEWLQLDLGQDMDVRGVVIQGPPRSGCPNNSPHHITSYKVQTATSDDPTLFTWRDYGKVFDSAASGNKGTVKAFFSQSTELTGGASAGDSTLSVGSSAGFVIGNTVKIENGALSETNKITGFGSIILETPLTQDFPAGTKVSKMEVEVEGDGESVDGGEDAPEAEPEPCDETLSGNGANYVGCQTKTRSGRTCQKWTTRHPHSHRLSRVGDHNYCRNPDGEPSIWCYTTDVNKRWELCNAVVDPNAPTSAPTPPPPIDNLHKGCWHGSCKDNGKNVCSWCGTHDDKQMYCCRKDWTYQAGHNCHKAGFSGHVRGHHCVTPFDPEAPTPPPTPGPDNLGRGCWSSCRDDGRNTCNWCGTHDDKSMYCCRKDWGHRYGANHNCHKAAFSSSYRGHHCVTPFDPEATN